MVQGLLLPECSFTAPRYAVHGVPQTTQRPRGRSRSRQAVRSAASPEKQGQNVPQNSREAPTSSGFPARSLSPTKRSAESRNVAVSATSSAQAQVTGQLANLWGAYSKRLEVDPVRTKALTSFAGFMIGDFLAQRIGQEPFDPLRCLRLGAYGLFLDGPVGHWWYKVLDKNVMPDKSTSTPAVLLKTAADQLVWAPIMTVVFFAVLKSLEGHPELILSTVQDKLVKTVVANYVLWPGAHFINFKFVPSQHRILYNNCVSVIWSAYLSLAAHGLVGIGDPCSVYPTTWDEAVQYMICTADIKEDLLKGKV